MVQTKDPVLRDSETFYGAVAFVAFNVILISSLQSIRKKHYETFYILHVVMFLFAVVFLCFHKTDQFAPVVGAAGIIWAVDKLIRTFKTMYYMRNNTATLIPLFGLGTKVIFSRQVPARPGSHAFITIPKVRGFQSHPFTISRSGSGGLEFVIKAHQRFTLDLHKYALKHPGATVPAWLDGPYGVIPDFGKFNKVVLIAGGSGASFTVPVALDLVEKIGRISTACVEFVWVIRDERRPTQVPTINPKCSY